MAGLGKAATTPTMSAFMTLSRGTIPFQASGSSAATYTCHGSANSISGWILHNTTRFLPASRFLKFRLLWKRTSAPVIAAVVYLMILFPLHEYTQLRAAVALAFAYMVLVVFLDGKRFVVFLLFVLGVFF